MPLGEPSRFVRLVAMNALIGFAAAGLFVLAMLIFDVGGLSALILAAKAWGAVALLWFFTGLTFASLSIGAAVIALAARDR